MARGPAASNTVATAHGWKDTPIHTESCVCYEKSEKHQSLRRSAMAEQDDVTACGICSEPFRNGDVAVQAARWRDLVMAGYGAPLLREKKFWAHPMYLFSIAREAEGPASTVGAVPPELPDEALPEKRKPK